MPPQNQEDHTPGAHPASMPHGNAVNTANADPGNAAKVDPANMPTGYVPSNDRRRGLSIVAMRALDATQPQPWPMAGNHLAPRFSGFSRPRGSTKIPVYSLLSSPPPTTFNPQQLFAPRVRKFTNAMDPNKNHDGVEGSDDPHEVMEVFKPKIPKTQGQASQEAGNSAAMGFSGYGANTPSNNMNTLGYGNYQPTLNLNDQSTGLWPNSYQQGMGMGAGNLGMYGQHMQGDGRRNSLSSYDPSQHLDFSQSAFPGGFGNGLGFANSSFGPSVPTNNISPAQMSMGGSLGGYGRSRSSTTLPETEFGSLNLSSSFPARTGQPDQSAPAKGFGDYGDPNDFVFDIKTPPGRLDSPSFDSFFNSQLPSLGNPNVGNNNGMLDPMFGNMNNDMIDPMFGNMNNSMPDMYGNYDGAVENMFTDNQGNIQGMAAQHQGAAGQQLPMYLSKYAQYGQGADENVQTPVAALSAEAHHDAAHDANAQNIDPVINQDAGNVASGGREHEGAELAAVANVTNAPGAADAAIAPNASTVPVDTVAPVVQAAQVAPDTPGGVVASAAVNAHNAVIAPGIVITHGAPGDPDGPDGSGDADAENSDASDDFDSDDFDPNIPISVEFPEKGRPDVFDAGILKSVVDKCREYTAAGQKHFNSPHNIFMFHQIYLAQKMHRDGYYKGPFLLMKGIVATIEDNGELNMGNATLRRYKNGFAWFKISPQTKKVTDELLGKFVDFYPEYLDLVEFLQEQLEPDYAVVEDYINQVAPNDVNERALEKCLRMPIPFPKMPSPTIWDPFFDDSDEGEDELELDEEQGEKKD
ncbi:hypothetical protein F5Y18DRAFT_427483 [Xylariaceae sp. FL1019]|nr:hypothetical protein F5Y18DRAFT_427483 [Xylariaceae sp. FL1019]